MFRKFALYTICAIAFGVIGSGVCFGSDFNDTHPPLNGAMFSPVSAPTAKICNCKLGGECKCGDNCQCADETIELNGLAGNVAANSVGCGQRAAARRAARQQAPADDSQSMQPVQTMQPVQQMATTENVCPCCGMSMTPEQMATIKTKSAPVQCAPVQTYTTMPVYQNFQARPGLFANPIFGGGNCSGGSCSGGSCSGGSCGQGAGRGFFRR